MLVIVPVMTGYARLVDSVQRYQVLTYIVGVYALLCAIFAYTLAHPVFGLPNATASPTRLLGWFFLISMDLYPTLITGTFWAFVNSISTPEFAKKTYGPIAACSKIAAIGVSGLSWLFTFSHHPQYIPLLLLATTLILCITLAITLTFPRIIPHHPAPIKKNKPRPSMVSGLTILLKSPYLFGIFLSYYSYEIIFALVEYQGAVKISTHTGNNVVTMTSYLFLCTLLSQGLGFFFSLIATPILVHYCSMATCLIVTPASIGIIMLISLFCPHFYCILAALILLPALHFGINSPIREMLYIPTTKEIQFKSKAWIDSFGRTVSKSSGALFAMITQTVPLVFTINALFSIAVTVGWATFSLFLGRKYTKTVTQHDIIDS